MKKKKTLNDNDKQFYTITVLQVYKFTGLQGYINNKQAHIFMQQTCVFKGCLNTFIINNSLHNLHLEGES